MSLPFRVYAPAGAHAILVHCEIARPTGPASAILVTGYLPKAGNAGFSLRMTDAADGRWPAADRTERFGDRLVHIASRGPQTSAWFFDGGTAVTVSGQADPATIVSVAGTCRMVV